MAGFKAQIPCDIEPPTKDEMVIMVFWYKDGKEGEPIYSVDARGRAVGQAKLWSDPYVFGERATMRTNVVPAELEIDPLQSTDGGVYTCRVDFKDSPTKNQKINLTVIGELNRSCPYHFLPTFLPIFFFIQCRSSVLLFFVEITNSLLKNSKSPRNFKYFVEA